MSSFLFKRSEGQKRRNQTPIRTITVADATAILRPWPSKSIDGAFECHSSSLFVSPSTSTIACIHAITMKSNNDCEITCMSCGLIVESLLGGYEQSRQLDEADEKAAQTGKTESMLRDKIADATEIGRALVRIKEEERTDTNKRKRDEMKIQLDAATMSEKRSRMRHRDSTSTCDTFVSSVTSLMSHFSDELTMHRVAIESTARLVYNTSIVCKTSVVAAYLLNTIADVPHVDLRLFIDGLSAVPAQQAKSMTQSIATTLARVEEMDAPTPAAAVASPSDISNDDPIALSYYALQSAPTERSHSSATVNQIKHHIVSLCIMIGQPMGAVNFDDTDVDELIAASSVGARNLESTAGAVLYLMSSRCVRSYKRIQQMSVRLYLMNNDIAPERRDILNQQANKDKPKLHPTLTDCDSAGLMAIAYRVQYGADIDTIDAAAKADIESRYTTDNGDWDELNDQIVDIENKRADFIRSMKKRYPPHGCPTPSDISMGLQSPASDIHKLCVELSRLNLLGDTQTIWPNKYEQQQMKHNKTAAMMRSTAILIKRTMPTAKQKTMRPIQANDMEHTEDDERRSLLWSHIRDLARHYMQLYFVSNAGQKFSVHSQSVIHDRLDQQFVKARLQSGKLLFKQEHETVAASMLVSCMATYWNKKLIISASTLYNAKANICKHDVSPASMSKCTQNIQALGCLL